MTFPAMKPALGAIAATFLLAGCVSIGGKAPDKMFTLTPAQTAAVGSGASGEISSGIAVLEPGTSQRLDVTRVPVQTSEATLAYLQYATWVEKPTKLFQRLVAETIRARGTRLVLDGGDAEYAARTQLNGNLIEMGYDAQTGSVTVTFDAMLSQTDGTVRTRRFSATESGIPAEADFVGPALNRAANQVAVEVANWVN